MAKTATTPVPSTLPQPPAETPGAPGDPTVPQNPSGDATGVPPVDPPKPPLVSESKSAKKDAKRRYRVNWTLRGFQGERYEAGEEVTATDAEAAPYLGKALTLIEKA